VSRAWLAAAILCALHGTPERVRGDRMHKGLLAVDDDHGKVDAVAPLELLVAVDRHAAEAEAEPRCLALEHRERASAEPAARPLVEYDLDVSCPRR
jgi:hypothetical protein